MKIIKNIIKSIPGTVALHRTFLKFLELKKERINYVRQWQRESTTSITNQDEYDFIRARNLLTYTKVSGKTYRAVEYPAGYHTLSIKGHELVGQRNPNKRLKNIPIDFTGKRVLDIGSNQGGMLFSIADKIEWGIGLDYDPRLVNVANAIAKINKYSNLDFYLFDVDKEPLEMIFDFLPDPHRVDVIFLLSVNVWFSKWEELIKLASQTGAIVVVEINGDQERQDRDEKYLYELFNKVVMVATTSEDDPVHKRRMFV